MTFSNDVLSFECAYQRSGDSIFAGKKCPKICLTIHWSVKRRDIDLVWELLRVIRSRQSLILSPIVVPYFAFYNPLLDQTNLVNNT